MRAANNGYETETTCGRCGAGLPSSARFCGVCGNDQQPAATSDATHVDASERTEHVSTTDETPVEDEVDDVRTAPSTSATAVVLPQPSRQLGLPPSRFPRPTAALARRRLHPRWVAITVAGAALATLVGIGVQNDLSTRGRLTTTRHTLASTRTDLETTRTQLATTTADLSSTKLDLTSTKAALEKANSDLSAKEQELSGVRNSLSDAHNQLTMQAGQIETLKSCLNGVVTALSDVADDDYYGAASALNAVQVSCQSASQMF